MLNRKFLTLLVTQVISFLVVSQVLSQVDPPYGRILSMSDKTVNVSFGNLAILRLLLTSVDIPQLNPVSKLSYRLLRDRLVEVDNPHPSIAVNIFQPCGKV